MKRQIVKRAVAAVKKTASKANAMANDDRVVGATYMVAGTAAAGVGMNAAVKSAKNMGDAFSIVPKKPRAKAPRGGKPMKGTK